MGVITETHRKWLIYSQLPKCGEVTASADGVLFGLTCGHCRSIFRLKDAKYFLRHQQQQHAKELRTAGCGQEQDEFKEEDEQEGEEKAEQEQEVEKKCEVKAEQEEQVKEEKCDSKEDNTKVQNTRKLQPDVAPSLAPHQADGDLGNDPPTPMQQKTPSRVATATETAVNVDPLEVADTFCANAFVLQRKVHLEDSVHVKEEVCIKKEHCEAKFRIDSDAEEDDINSKSDTDDPDKLFNFKLDLQSPENYEVLSYIIEVYEQNPVLWNVEHVLHSFRDSKVEIFKEMKNEIWTRFKIMIEQAHIRETFAGLRKLYNEALLNEIEDEQLRNVKRKIKNKRAPAPQLWCFEQLQFLRDQELAENSKVKTTGDQFLQLAEIYKRYSLLWDSSGDDSHDRMRVGKTQRAMLKETNEQMNLHMTLPQLRARIKRLRAYYYADKSKRISYEDFNKPFEPQQPLLYEKLRFLEPFVGPYRCERCDEEISVYPLFKAHMAEHDGRLPYKCSHCQKDFRSFSIMAAHRRKHTQEKPYSCSTCEARFARSTELKLHQAFHSGERKCICHVCGAAYRNASLLNRHKMCSHNPNKARYQCDKCPKSFAQQTTLKDHMNKHLNQRNAVCPVCGKAFHARNILRQHMQLHDKVKKYQCEFCDVKFAQKSGLSTHRRRVHDVARAEDFAA